MVQFSFCYVYFHFFFFGEWQWLITSFKQRKIKTEKRKKNWPQPVFKHIVKLTRERWETGNCRGGIRRFKWWMGKEGRALLGSLSNDDGKNAVGEDWQNNNFIYTCITLFCTFLCPRCTTTTWKCLISRFNEDVNRRQQLSFSFPELWYSLLRIQLIKIANIWRIKRDGISVIKFEATRSHFLSDVFVAVAGVVASAPYWLTISVGM